MSDRTRQPTKPLLPAAVPSCHSPGANTGAGPGAPVIALAGTPNAGKSTLFNALTGARVTMGNWPGTTVEISSGVLAHGRPSRLQHGRLHLRPRHPHL